MAAAPWSSAPHPRGWSRLPRAALGGRALLPAPAGMVPSSAKAQRAPSAAPRTRGDGPERRPAGPGAHPVLRARRDGPGGRVGVGTLKLCSPHLRGWSGRIGGQVLRRGVLSTPAGMVPACRRSARRATSVPRIRGDGPDITNFAFATPRCFLHPRGMVPTVAVKSTAMTTAPRTGRGCSLEGLVVRGLDRLLPATRGWSRHSTARNRIVVARTGRAVKHPGLRRLGRDSANLLRGWPSSDRSSSTL